MVVHECNLNFFIPKKETQFIIMGTMVAINARSIDGIKPKEKVFYYNNNRNHFWRVIQFLLEPKKEAKKNLTINEKKIFLEKHGIAICNIVQKVEVPNKDKLDPSDTVLFDAYKKDRIEYKKLSAKVKKLIETKPIYFTCRKKKGIDDLLIGFLTKNNLRPEIKDNIWYWATPTRCNPEARANMWREEMIAHQNGLKR